MTETENTSKGILVNEISKISTINPRFHRISSMLLDHFLMTLVIVPPMIILVLLATNGILRIDNGTFSWVFFSMMFIYINKDFLNAKSPAKRILGYQVINRKTEKPASELQCFLRNLTICIAWPLEVIVGFINPERRIGDYIANTKVVISEKQKLKTIWVDLKSKTPKLDYIGILIFGIIYFYGLSLLMPSMN